jgi:DUF971 family protein
LREDFKAIEPSEMTWTPVGEARIVWSDGHESLYPRDILRKICPCAECKGTHTGQPKAFNILNAAQVQGAPRQIVVEGVAAVGNYAIAFTWGDGHDTGIYSFAYLRDQCPCDACRTRRVRQG